MNQLSLDIQEPSLYEVACVVATRVGHAIGARWLKAYSLAVGRSWPETLGRVKQLDQSSSVAINSARAGLGLLRVHSLVGSKRLTWYLTSGIQSEMLAAFNKFVDESPTRPLTDDQWTKKYPFPMTPTDVETLKAFNAHKPVLVSVWKEKSRTFYQFFTVRTYTERSEIDPRIFSRQAYSKIKQYSKIIGVQDRYTPCFDTVVVDQTVGRVEIRLDVPASNIPNDIQIIAEQRLLVKFNEIVYSACGVSVVGLNVFNFFPLIRPLYRDQDAGSVSVLGFAAYGEDSASNNTGKPIRRKGQDLRRDRFHKGGADAVEDLRPYTIGVEWPSLFDRNHTIELEIPGNIQCLYRSQALTVATVDRCLSYDDYEFLVERIEHFSQVAADEARRAATEAQQAIANARAGV